MPVQPREQSILAYLLLVLNEISILLPSSMDYSLGSAIIKLKLGGNAIILSFKFIISLLFG